MTFYLPPKKKSYSLYWKSYVHNTLLFCPIRATVFYWSFKMLARLWLLLATGNRASAYVAPCTCLNSLFATFADLHDRKVATFANLRSYTHAYCSFVLLNEAISIVSGSHCAHELLIWLFGFPYDLQVKRYSELKKVLPRMAPQFQCAPK